MSAVLMVIDDPIQRHVLTSLLETAGVEVLSCQSGEQVEQALDDHRDIDALVVHLQTLEKEKWRVCRMVRASECPKIRTLPILVLSATHSESEARDFLHEIQIQGFLSLPVGPTRFVEAVRRLRLGLSSMGHSPDCFQMLFEALPDMGFIYDETQIIRHVNAAVSQQLGWQPTDIIGQNIQRLFTQSKTLLGHPDCPTDGFRNGQWTETQILKQNGEPLDVEVFEQLLSTHGTSATCVLARANAGRKQVEKEKACLEHQLQKVQQVLKMEAVGRLAAGVAHDVNNILTAIMGHASLLQTSIIDRSSLKDVGEVLEQAVRRGQHLTMQLLGFARQGKHQHMPVDLHQVIRETFTLLRQTISSAITTDLTLSASHSWVVGDPDQLHQVFMNLVLNACDAMSQGGILCCETGNEVVDETMARQIPGLTPGNFLVICVRDTGQGISPEVSARIFEPFFTTKEYGKGSGMGLAMVYGIVKSHQGYIAVSSEPGWGTTMKVYLPWVSPPLDRKHENLDTMPLHGKGHVLVVDDEKIVAETASELLKHLGYSVAMVMSGHEALDYCRLHANQVDLVLLDMIMDDMSGADCFSALRRLQPDLNVLLCTGYDRNHAVQELLDQGVAGFIQKPYDLHELSRAVGSVLAHQVA